MVIHMGIGAKSVLEPVHEDDLANLHNICIGLSISSCIIFQVWCKFNIQLFNFGFRFLWCTSTYQA